MSGEPHINDLKLGHVKVSEGTLDDFVAKISAGIAAKAHQFSVPLNLSKFVMSKSDPKLSQALNDSDYVVADGKSIEILARRVGNKKVHRVTGVDLAETLLAKSKEENWRLFLLGTKPENLAKAVESINQRYDSPNIVGSQDGYFKPDEIDAVIDKINAADPDILFLGLGLPQKEYFIVDHFDKLNVRFCITVGGAIDIWAGAKTRAPALIQKLGLEWLYRSLYDLSRAGLIFRYGLEFLKDLIFPPKPQ
jgi:N-acetylglucosaminyldiphosphoundecaprenol N-acetyl-beta-D-mannosaminyltransferase